ncbi:MAG: sugar isomerase [Candidatus Omnitrophica bacterium]|nr:sugar isomerase [Candidatus Omnitrophota bacterium]
MRNESEPRHMHAHCCPCGGGQATDSSGIPRREFFKASGLVLGGVALGGLAWKTLAGTESGLPTPASRKPLVVQPIFTYPLPQRRPQTSWRAWGGIQTTADVQEEENRIKGELNKLERDADFPVQFLPLATIRRVGELDGVEGLTGADLLLVYAAGDGGGDLTGHLNVICERGKDVIIFVRHRSGPLYYWYEGISARYLRQSTDKPAVKVAADDVVVDSQEDVLWRLRALAGLKNTRGSRILAIGGPAGWETPKAPDLAREKWKLDIQTVTYAELGNLIKQARADDTAVSLARQRAGEYLKDAGLKLETERRYVENCFLLEQIFRVLLSKAEARAMTINECMGTIMPMAQTTACLTLSLLNDAGYMAFCESDFVVIPSGLLLANISGRPVFLNDPTYPHQGIITLAHCTAPRRLDGQSLDPVRILTHFESDYGAAPKVEMRKGQRVTNLIPDFKSEHWTGFLGEIVEAPFLPICRSQIEVSYKCPDIRLAENMPGFHWMTCYGDYTREVGYALRRVSILWENLG